MTYYVSSGTLNPTHSLTRLFSRFTLSGCFWMLRVFIINSIIMVLLLVLLVLLLHLSCCCVLIFVLFCDSESETYILCMQLLLWF